MGSSCCKAKPKTAPSAPGDPTGGGDVRGIEADVIAEDDQGGIVMAMPEAVKVQEQHEQHDAAVTSGDAKDMSPEDRRKQMLQGYSTLHSAAGAGNIEVLEGAIDSGDFDIEDTRKDGQTPLLMAAKEGQLKTVELLIKKKANLEAVKLPPKGKEAAAEREVTGHTPLHFAAFNKQIPVVQALLKAKANIEAKANKGTPIVWATAQSAYEVMEVLANNGANLNFMMMKGKDVTTGEDNDGWAPIHLAVKGKDMKAIQILAMKKANLEIQLSNGSTPLALAAMTEATDVMKCLVSCKADVEAKAEGTSLLLRAAHAGQTEVIKTLVECKADINFATEEGMTASHTCTSMKNSDALKAIIDAKANLETLDEDKNTPFLIAVLNDYEDGVKMLMEAQCNVDAKYAKNDTPMHIACAQGLVKMVALLCEMEVTPNGVNDNGQTPLHILCASIEKRSLENNTALIKSVCAAKADTTIKLPGADGTGGKTALGLLRKSGDKEGAKELQAVMREWCPKEFTLAARAQAAAEELAEKAKKAMEAPAKKYTYKEGDEVEVWSNSNQCWCQGKVTKVEGGLVSCDFEVPGKGPAKKDIPAANVKDLRPKGAE